MGIPLSHPAIQQAIDRGLIRPADLAPRPTDAMPEAFSETTEKQFMAVVMALARENGWEVYHTFDSRRSTAGLPDLLLIKPGRLIVAELKVGKRRVTREQEKWLQLFATVPGVRTYRWRPSDRVEIIEVLTVPAL
jgi:hypothetical protein